MQSQITVPVLLIAFNRPDTTKIVFDKIRAAQPLKLYVAVDGPRDSKKGEADLVKEVREIVQDVDWKCETQYKFNDINQGAEVTVSSAVTWSLKKEEYVIVLEDDIVAPLAFFRFAEEMLIRYKDIDRIATVAGSNYTPIKLPNGEDYFFAKYGHTWGWATWKRTWEKFDLYTDIPDEHLDKNFLGKICNNRAETNFYRKLFKVMKQNGPGNSTWDYVFLYKRWISNSISVIPRVNLTSNIGVFGLHARGKTENHFRPFDEQFKVIKHPEKVECNVEYDKHHFRKHINFRRTIVHRIFKKILNITRRIY
jgi:hypothetical protein